MSDIPEGLITAIQNRRIVPFVGAGLSLSVGELFPSWPQLIEQFAARLQQEARAAAADQVRALAAAGNLLDAAEAAEEALYKPEFLEEMRRAFDRPRPVDANLTGVGAIWRMRPPLVITTNFESVLQWPLELPDAVPYQAPLRNPVLVHNDDAALLAEIDDPPDDAPRIWHLHGSVSHPDTIILTARQFERLYGPANGKPPELTFALDRLRNLLATRPLFFVGFSLSDPYVLRHIRAVLALTEDNSPVSYLFIKAGEKEPAALQPYQIQLVEFEEFGDPMVARLNAIVAKAIPELSKVDVAANAPITPDLLEQLRVALTGLLPDPVMIADAYNRSRPKGWPPFPIFGDGELLLKSAIERLARAAMQSGSTGGHPLLYFVDELRVQLANHAPALQQWIDAAIQVLGPHEEDRARLRRTLQIGRAGGGGGSSYVLVRVLEHDARRWSVQAWSFNDAPGAVGEALFEDERDYEPADCARLVKDLMIEMVSRGIDRAEPVIAFLLPRSLLCEKVDGWRPTESSFEPSLGSSYAVTVRPLDRDRLTRAFVQRFWSALRQLEVNEALELVGLEQIADQASTQAVWLRASDPAVPGTLRKLRGSGVTCVVLESPPRRPGDAPSTLFELVLSAGVPAVLWVRDPAADTAAIRHQLGDLLAKAPVLDLPRRLRKLRADEEDQGAPSVGSHLGLLWDAVDYLPPDQDPDNRAVV